MRRILPMLACCSRIRVHGFVAIAICLSMHLHATGFPGISYLGIEKGLSNNSVRCIFQDQHGYMWFGTFDGLNRYDGYEFKVFRNRFGDTTSLSHNYINTITADHHNNIWVGTGQGISIYNALTARFKPAFFIDPVTKERVLLRFNVAALKANAAGDIYIGTNSGGLLVQANGSDAAIPAPCVTDANGGCRWDVEAIEIDKQQRAWVFYRNVGLCLYDASTRQVKVLNRSIASATCLQSDGKRLWIGTNSGLYRYDIESGNLDLLPGMYSSATINGLSFDKEGRLWIGTLGHGMGIYSTATGRVDYLSSQLGEKTLSSEDVAAIYEDRDNRKWIGTLKGGIDIIDPQKSYFTTIAADPQRTDGLAGNFVSGMLEATNHEIWIGTDGNGISVWDSSQLRFTNYRHQPGNPSSLSHNSVPSFCQDYKGDIWIATFGGGVNRFNRATGSFEHYTCRNGAGGETYDFAWLVYEDRDKTLWVATYGNGLLFRLNRQTNRFEPFCQEHVDVYTLMEDSQGELWAGTPYGLAKIDRQHGSFKNYETGKPVRAIWEAGNGKLWIGTEGRGLLLFDKQQEKITAAFTADNGLCNNSVLNILEDSRRHLWLSTFYGLSEFDPQHRRFRNYYQEDGLQSDQFAYNAAVKLHNGIMLFGGIKGFNVFNPTALQTRKQFPPVMLTALRINGQPVTGSSNYLLSASGDKVSAVKIPFNEAVVSVDFAALEYSAPGKISYAYYLEGWDKGWNYGTKARTANYTRLSEGNYTLHIKSTNADGAWNPEEISVRITVTPPWYRSWWAYALYLLLFGWALLVYQRYRVRQARMAYEVKLARLNAAREKAERENERLLNEQEKAINEKRLSFFTDISHEFRTPLTLVINPLKDMLAKHPDNEDAAGLNIVYRNARRMLSLVDQLLLFRKSDTGAGQLKIARLNFYSLCQEVFLAFVQQAKSLGIDYSFEAEDTGCELYGDREKLEIILYNLVSNALKYTSAGGSVIVALKETVEGVQVIVSDTGVGIPLETGGQVFERFYQVQENGKASKPGFGIGLYLVKQFVENHHGTISYESEPGNGTRFFVSLKKGSAHFGGLPVADEAPGETIAQEILQPAAPAPIEQGSGTPRSLITERDAILMADDDEQMLEYLTGLFKEKYTVFCAKNGDEAVKMAYRHLPDLIISDVKMPGVSGIEFCRTIKDDPTLSHIPVILLTGESSQEKKLMGVEGGADDYITKPFDSDLLQARVTNLLKARVNLQNYFYNVVTLRENKLVISDAYRQFLERCMAAVEKNLDDEDFNVKTLAAELNISHSSLYKKVKSVSGQSVTAFIRFIRLRKAAELLINSNLNINEAAAEVGFNNPKYFREQFAKLFGMNPSDYVKKYRKAFGKNFHLDNNSFKKD